MYWEKRRLCAGRLPQLDEGLMVSKNIRVPRHKRSEIRCPILVVQGPEIYRLTTDEQYRNIRVQERCEISRRTRFGFSVGRGHARSRSTEWGDPDARLNCA